MKHIWWAGLAVGLFVLAFIAINGQKNGPSENDAVRMDDGASVQDGAGQMKVFQMDDGDVSDAVQAGKMLSRGNCEGEEKPQLSVLPMRYEDFAFIIPYGLMVGGHVTPIDHQYFTPTIFQSPRDTYEVRAMADAKVVDIQERTTDRGTEFRLVFSMSCKLFYYYDLVTSLTPELKKAYDENRSGQWAGSLSIPVIAGQQIGRIGGQTLDFAVWDMDAKLTGFVVPEHYDGESWKIHTVDPIEYYTDELKGQVLSKYIRTAEPRSGKIDYDIDGKLVGNWFLEGSGGYVPQDKQGGQTYWKGHLSLTYDNYDPTSIVVSMGDYGGQEAQFGVKGNTPDPATVDTAAGVIKYELVMKSWVDPKTGSYWDRDSLVKGLVAKNQENQVQGTVLVQMLEGRKMRFEAFPGKSADQVSGFTGNAKVFER